jgi:hypothetical protein
VARSRDPRRGTDASLAIELSSGHITFRVGTWQGIATFTALQRRGVPSEMLYLPGENHHCLNPQNSVVWHETVMRWIKSWTE